MMQSSILKSHSQLFLLCTSQVNHFYPFPYPPFYDFRQGRTPLSEPYLFYYPFCTCGFKTRKSQRHAWQEQELNLRFVQMLNPTCLIAPRSESGLSCHCPFSVCKDCAVRAYIVLRVLTAAYSFRRTPRSALLSWPQIVS